MNRGVLIGAVVAVIVLGGAAYYLHRPRPKPVEVVTPAPAPRVVPKKVDPPAPIVTTPAAETPKKAPPKKAAAEPAPAPAAPAAPTHASLKLESDVPGASVFIDRQFVGNTPLSLDKLEPGSKRIQLTATGFDSVQKTIELTPGPNEVTIR